MRALILGACGAALLVASGAPAQRVPPRGEPDSRAKAAAGLAPRVKVWVEDDARAAASRLPERNADDSYDRYGDYDQDDRRTLGRQRIFFRVDEDAHVTVASIASDGQVRILYPESPWNERPAPGGLTLDLAPDGGELTGGGGSDGSGYVVALASYEPADYGDYAGRDGWRSGVVPPPVVLDRSAAYPVGGIEELANQLYRRGVPYALDFAYYRVVSDRPYAGYPGYPSSYPSRRPRYSECAALAARWGVPPGDVWSSYESDCLIGAYGYGVYGYGVYGNRPPGYGRYGYGPPGRRAPLRPPRAAARQVIGAQAARDARRALRPRGVPRGLGARGSDGEARPRRDGAARGVEGPGRDAARARKPPPGAAVSAPRVEPRRAEPRRLERQEPEMRRPADRSRSSARSIQRGTAAERRGRP
jgi:hypothetical protein